MEHITQWLSQLYGDLDADQRAYAWSLQDKRTHWFSSDELPQAAEWVASAAADRDVYCGVSFAQAVDAERAGARRRLRQSPSPTEPDAALTGGVVALVADIDIAGDGHATAKPYPASYEEALAILQRAPLQPTALVHSGNGLHAWWHLKEPWRFADGADRLQAMGVFKGWGRCLRRCAKALGCDIDPVQDLARILRIPGTLNHKGGGARPVRLVSAEWDRRYSPADFDDFREPVTEAEAHDSVVLTGALEFPWSKHETLSENLDGYRATWEHKRRDLEGKSCSEYDLALANYAARAGWSDEEIAALIRGHRSRFPGAAEKGARIDYLQRTIAKARAASSLASREANAAAVVRDDDADRSARVQALATILDIDLDEIRHIAGPSGVYEFHLLGKCVEIPAARLRDQAYFAGQIFDLTNRSPVTVPARPSKERSGGLLWRDIMHAIADAAEEVASPEDVSERGGTLSVLREFCAEHQLAEYPPGLPPPPGQPFVREGRVWVHLDTFRRYCASIDFPLERGTLIQRLHGWGALPGTVAVRAGPSRSTTRAMYGVPRALVIPGDRHVAQAAPSE